MRRMLAGLWTALLLTMAGVDPVHGQEPPQAEQRYVTGADAAALLVKLERINKVSLPRADLLIVTLPGSPTALFWVFVDGVPIGSGYCPVALVEPLLGRPA